MATETFKLENGDTLEVTTTEESSVIKEVVDKTIVTQKVSKKIIPGIPTPANKLPMVSAGTDQTIKLPVSEVTLTGVVSDSDGTVVSVLWEKIAGGNANIVSVTSISTKVTGLVLGTYQFRLTAIDDKGGKTADDLTITVQPADVIIPPTGKVDYLKLPAFTGSVKDDIVISRVFISNPTAVGLNLVGRRNIKLIECYFGFTYEEGISFENSNGLSVERCLFNNNAGAIYTLNSSNINVIDSQFLNTWMRRTGGSARGQFVQVQGSNDIIISGNKGENFQGESNPEDIISFHSSSNGVCKNNMFRGGGPSSSGGGIICGDNGGNNVVLEYNTLLNPGQYGTAIAGGTNMKILNNKIYSEQKPWSNNPLYVWAQGNQIGISSNATVKDNRVHWVDRNGAINNGWNAGNISNTAWEDPTSITLAEMNVPDHLIDFVTPAELLTIRK